MKNEPKKRQQLTLFLDPKHAEVIEVIRKTFNPVQFDLIKSHVTLCREDEIEAIDQVIANLTNLNSSSLTISFDPVIRFSEGKGVMIPAKKDNEAFQILRQKILKGIIEKPRRHHPHITLMHPRNSTCTDDIFTKILAADLPRQIEFKSIGWIEQEIGKPWIVLNEFKLDK